MISLVIKTNKVEEIAFLDNCSALTSIGEETVSLTSVKTQFVFMITIFKRNQNVFIAAGMGSV
jgi:hypothetical protein